MFNFEFSNTNHMKARRAPIPETGWRPPSFFPNLDVANVISIDTETYDPLLKEYGPGWGRGAGHIVGFSVAARTVNGETGAWYFPINHSIERELNLEGSAALSWLSYILSKGLPIIGANLTYDVGWLTSSGVNGDFSKLIDIQIAEALIDSRARVNLDALGSKYLNKKKETNLLYQWIREAYQCREGSERANIYRSPPSLVGPYAEMDALLPLLIYDKQYPILAAKELNEVFSVECGLIPLTVKMRLLGIQVDVDRAYNYSVVLDAKIKELKSEMFSIYGKEFNPASNKDMTDVCNKFGIQFEVTAKGNPSFDKLFLRDNKDNKIINLLTQVRELEKLNGTFLKSYILDSNVKGKLHCQLHQIKGDESGTITGRYSSSHPNLQNIPSRSENGKQARKLFIPDNPNDRIVKFDYSQIEYRMLAHFAVDGNPHVREILNFWEGNALEWGHLGFADSLRREYREDPKTDYHNVTQKKVLDKTGIALERKFVKNVNFGLLYGMQEKKLISDNGFTESSGKALFQAYHAGAPYVRATMDAVAASINAHGYVTTVLGRRTAFDEWQAQRGHPLFNLTERLTYHDAIRKYGTKIQRVDVFKGVNYMLQGSAADVFKKALYIAFKSGVFDVVGYPRLLVHDEAVFSQSAEQANNVDAWRYLRHVMENPIPLRVPILTEWGAGKNWGEIE